MDPKSEKEIPPLPEDTSKFWNKAEKNEFKIGEPVNCDLKKHKFFQVEAQEVKCEICNVGFILPIDGILRDGHIYINEQLVI